MGGESGDDYDPGPWKGWDYKSARAAYDPTAGRSYDSVGSSVGSSASLTQRVKDCVPKGLSTNSPSPVVIAVDVTGSMKEWPGIIFEKLPLLDLELKKYLDSPEICFMAVGDAYSDQFPLQVQQFAKGLDLAERINALKAEGGGGAQIQESYELAAVYATHKIDMPNAVKPIFIYIGDEKLYPHVNGEHAKTWAGVELESEITSKEAIAELKKKFSVYCIRKLYDSATGDKMSMTDQGIHNQWADYLGIDHIAILPEPRRVGDTILGIIAKETGREEYFMGELTERQTPKQKTTVMKALETVHDKSKIAKKDGTKSVMKSKKDDKKSKGLM